MKKISLIIATAVLMGCTAQESEGSDSTTEDSTTVTEVEVVQNPHNLILIDGEKWVIDEGMRVSIDSIEIRMQAFEGVSMADYEVLSMDLQRHTKSIIANCTMTGQAHDELHKWLLPFIDLRKELNGITTVEEGALIVTELNDELSIFKTYFY